LQDTLVLLLEHDIGESDNEEINAKQVCSILGKEWGFYHTVTTNLERAKSYLQDNEILNNNDKAVVAGRIDKIHERIEAAPKTMAWKMRARVGPSVKWYNVVEEVQRD
jgi:hypothetical protein